MKIKNFIRIKLLFILLFYNSIISYSATFYASQTGNFNNLGVWRTGSCTGPSAGTLPGPTDDIVVCSGVTLRITGSGTVRNVYVYGTLTQINNITFNISNLYLYTGSVLAGTDNNGTYRVSGDVYLYDGATIHGTANFNLNITGNLYNEPVSGYQAIVGRVDLTVTGTTYINGNFAFTQSASGNKRLNGGLNISSTAIFNNTVGEDPFINGDIVNDGAWIGCTGGNCVYTLGNIAGRIINITGTNPIPISTIIMGNASSVVNNYATIILDRTFDNNTLLRNVGTFNNYGTLYVGRGGETTPIVNTVIFNASYAGNTVVFQRNGNQQVRIPNDGSYYNLVIAGLGTKYLQTTGATLTVTNALYIKDNSTLWIKDVETLNGTASLTMTDNSVLRIDKCSPPSQPELTGTYTLQDNSTILLSGACAQTLNPSITNVVNITLDGSGSKDISSLTNIEGNLTINTSASLSGTFNFIQNCNGSFIYNSTVTTNLLSNLRIGSFIQTNGTINAGSFTIEVCGSLWRYNGGTFNSATGLVKFNNNVSIEGSQITTFNDVLIDNSCDFNAHINQINIKSTFTNNGNFVHRNGTISFTGTNAKIQGNSNTIFNNIAIAAGAQLTGHSSQFYVEGNWTNSGGTYLHNNGTVYFIGNNNVTLTKAGTETFYKLYIIKLGATITSNITTLTIDNELNISDGTLIIGTNTLNGTGGLTMTGGELRIAKLTTVPELTGTYSLTGGTVHLNGNGAQTLQSGAPGSNTYYNLILSTAGNKNIVDVTTINGDITVLGTATISNHSAFIQASDKSFIYNSTGTTAIQQNITIGSFYQTNGTVNPNGRTITIKGDIWQKLGGTFSTSGTVVFNGFNTQSFTDNGTIFSNVTVNNTNNLILNNNLLINTSLNLTNGQIITGNNIVSLRQTTTTISRTNGWVNGWLEMNLPNNNPNRNFHIGTSNYYTNLQLTFSGNNAGTLRCRAVENDHPDIFSTDIDINKTVNVYWEVLSSTINTGTVNISFNYPVEAVDELADPSNFKIARYILPNATYYDPSATPTFTNTLLNSYDLSGLASGLNTFIIGEKYNPQFVYNANVGNILWSNEDNWIQIRSGVISCNTSSNIVTGVNTLFTQELNVGDKIALQSNPSAIVGIVQNIIDDVTLELQTNSTQNAVNASFGRKKLPDIDDIVNIGFMPISSANVNVNLDIDAQIHQLRYTPMARSNSVTFLDNTSLFVRTNVFVNAPSIATNTNALNVNNATLNINGNLVIGIGANTNRISVVNLNNGIINVNTNLIFNSPVAASAVLNITGTGRVNLGNTFIVNNTSTSNRGTFNPGTNGIFCYCGTAVGQTVYYNTTNTPNIVYRNLYFGNTSGSGVTIPSNITTTNVTGDIVVESGLFYYNNLTITGNAGRTFTVKDNATLRMTGASSFPTGFTYNFETASNVEYRQTNNLTITRVSYGNLYCIPATNVTQRFPGTDITIKGNLYLGGPNGSTLDIAINNPNVFCENDVIINSNTTLNFSNNTTKYFYIKGNWINNSSIVPSNLTQSTVVFNGTNDQQITGSISTQYFPNVQVNKPSGKVYTSGITNTLNVNNLIVTSGEFDAPLNLNVNNGNSSVTIDADGVLDATNSTIRITGNWNNNGGSFVNTNSTVNFQGGNVQYIQGTASSQSFNDIVINKSNNYVAMNGSTVTFNNFTIYNRDFRSLIANSTVNINGNFDLEGSGGFLGTNITNLNIAGNIIHNSSGTWTMSTNVSLNGSAQQSISGTSTIPNFTNLTINNSSINNAIILNKPITVNGNLTLTNGEIVTSSTNILTMGATGDVVLNAPGGNQNLSYVKGPMRHTVNTNTGVTKVFPVGKGGLYHRIDLDVRQAQNTATLYTGEFFLSSASALGWSLPASIARVSNKDYWIINKGAGANISQAYVTLYFNTVFDEVDDLTNLTVAKGTPAAWSDIGGNIIAGGPDGAIKSTMPFTTFSYFSLASKSIISNPLPIELLDLRAFVLNDKIKIEWTTSSEINNDYFVVEKSYDLATFFEIGKVKGADFSNSMLNYSLIDENPVEGLQYYRLKQVDFDGNYSYSYIVSVLYSKPLSGLPKIDVFPNPASAEFYVNVTNFEPLSEVNVIITDLLGETVFSKTFILNDNGNNVININQNFKPSIYIVTVLDENKNKFTKKLIIK